MPKPKLKMNYKGMGALLKGAPASAALASRMQRALSAAQASAPVVSGNYKASLHIEQDTTDRAVARVVADVPYALIVEAETGNLARALGAAGGRS